MIVHAYGVHLRRGKGLDTMEYRGYTGTVEYDGVEGFFYGSVLDIEDTITYEADCEEGLEPAFRDSVDEYLDQCRACEVEPEQPRVAVEC